MLNILASDIMLVAQTFGATLSSSASLFTHLCGFRRLVLCSVAGKVWSLFHCAPDETAPRGS